MSPHSAPAPPTPAPRKTAPRTHRTATARNGRPAPRPPRETARVNSPGRVARSAALVASARRAGKTQAAREPDPRTKSSHEVFANQQIQLLSDGIRHGFAIGDDGVRQRRAALAGPRLRHARDGFGHHIRRVLRILDEVGDDVVYGDGVVL